jgi:hypothetical protein
MLAQKGVEGFPWSWPSSIGVARRVELITFHGNLATMTQPTGLAAHLR